MFGRQNFRETSWQMAPIFSGPSSLWLKRGGLFHAGGGDFDNVSIAQVKVVTKFDVGRDFNNGSRVMTSALLVRIGAKNKCAPAQNGTGNDVDRNRAAILLSFEASNFAGQGVRMIELNV